MAMDTLAKGLRIYWKCKGVIKTVRVSFVINEPIQDASGGYKMVYMYANSLVQNGHEVTIYYWCRKDHLFTNYQVPFRIKFAIAGLLALKGPKWFRVDERVRGIAIKEVCDSSIKNADIVIATAINTALPVYHLGTSKGKKAYFIQDFENWEYTDEEVYQTYALGMYNIVVAKWLKEIVDKHSPEKSIVVSNGIDSDIFFNRHLPRKTHSLVMQYRDTAYKGPECALKTIELLRNKYPDFTCSIISTNNRPKGLLSCCDFYQSITPEKVAELNNQAEVFICTSVEEGYGLPGLEAMACGCAVCSTSYKGVFEYARDGENALLSPINDAVALAQNVSELFEDDAMRMRIAEQAVATGESMSHEKMASLFEKVLEELSNE